MSHWMTSGATRLKARQRRTFAKRLKQKASMSTIVGASISSSTHNGVKRYTKRKRVIEGTRASAHTSQTSEHTNSTYPFDQPTNDLHGLLDSGTSTNNISHRRIRNSNYRHQFSRLLHPSGAKTRELEPTNDYRDPGDGRSRAFPSHYQFQQLNTNGSSGQYNKNDQSIKHTRGASKFQTSLETFEEEDEDEDYDMDFQSIDPPILQCSASQSTSRSIGYQDVPLAHNPGQYTRGGIHTENDLFANSLSFHSVEPSTIIKRSSLQRDSADFLSNNNNPHHIHSIGTKIDETSHHFNESDSYQLSNRVLQQTSLHPRPKGDVLPGLSEAASREFYLQFVNIERIERQSSFSSVSAGSSLKSHRSSSGGLPLKSSHGITGTQSSTGDTGRDKIRFFNDGVEIDYYGKLLSFDEADQKTSKYRTVSPKLYEDSDSQDKFAGKVPQPSQMTAQRASFWEEIEC